MISRLTYTLLYLSFLVILLFLASCKDKNVESLDLQLIIPDQGYVTGGTNVTLRGEYFDKDTDVFFGDSAAASVEYKDSERIWVVTPVHPKGLVDVTVTHPNRQSASLYDGFTFIEIESTILFFDGITSYRVGAHPGSMAISDFNQDGHNDIAITQFFDNEIAMLLNKGDGTFSPYIGINAADECMGIFNADYDGDGDDDLALCYYTGTVSVLLNNGDATFTGNRNYPVGKTPVDIFGSDLDGDGDIDLAVANADFEDPECTSSSISVLMNNGDGTFLEKVGYDTGPCTNSLILADLDSDGDSDIVAAQEHYLFTLMNDGNGTFTDMKRYQQGLHDHNGAPQSADLDSDGDLDLVVLSSPESNLQTPSDAIVYMNRGDGSFEYIARYSIADSQSGLSLTDLDNDGNIDLVTSSWDDGVVSVRRNLGGGSFGKLVTYPAGGQANSIKSSDLDGDGDFDIVVSNGKHTNSVSILYNQIQ